MSRLLLLILLLSPVEAYQPSIDDMHKAYLGAGWQMRTIGRETLVCIDTKHSLFADRVVQMIVDRAKGVRCV